MLGFPLGFLKVIGFRDFGVQGFRAYLVKGLGDQVARPEFAI